MYTGKYVYVKLSGSLAYQAYAGWPFSEHIVNMLLRVHVIAVAYTHGQVLCTACVQ